MIYQLFLLFISNVYNLFQLSTVIEEPVVAVVEPRKVPNSFSLGAAVALLPSPMYKLTDHTFSFNL